MEFSVKGHLVDIFKEEIYPAEVVVKEGKIESLRRIEESELNDTLCLVLLTLIAILKVQCLTPLNMDAMR